MPAFSFEKISPPVRRGPLPPIAKKQRGVIVKRGLRQESLRQKKA
jgi:hypothetical protein